MKLRALPLALKSSDNFQMKDKNITQEEFTKNVLDRQGKIRYYSGFNIEGFFKGYDKDKKSFDKSKLSESRSIWFYVGKGLISVLEGNVTEIGSKEDYEKVYLENLAKAPGSAIIYAAETSIELLAGSRVVPNVIPGVFSGLISINQIIDTRSANSWFQSRGPKVPVDKLYEVEIRTPQEKIDLSKLTYEETQELLNTGSKINLLDLSDRL